MTPWEFDTHRARMERYSRINRRIAFGIMAFAALIILGSIFTAAYIASTMSLDDLARKAGQLTRTFQDAAQ